MLSLNIFRAALAALFLLGTPAIAETIFNMEVFRVVEEVRMIDAPQPLSRCCKQPIALCPVIRSPTGSPYTTRTPLRSGIFP